MAKDFLTVVRHTRYPVEAFVFVQKGLDYTVKQLHGEPRPGDDPAGRHVPGRQLCLGLRDFALLQYGSLARTVLNHWQVRTSEDFGRIVYAMIDAGLMSKTDSDSLEDFVGVYDFSQAFAPTPAIR
jgi:uncharacterized repeat protein (TIGR04138 family)